MTLAPTNFQSGFASSINAPELNAMVQICPNVAALRRFIGAYDQTIFLAGTTTASDGGQGLYTFTLGSAADNGSSVIVPTGVYPPAYWKQIPFNQAGTGGSTLTSQRFVANAAISGSQNTGAYSYGTLNYSDVNILQSLAANANGYAQSVLVNQSAGASASSDFIVGNNQTTATTFYGDFGMNSSNYTGSGSLNLPNAVYLYAANGDLVLGTSTPNAVRFVVNNIDAGGIGVDGVMALTLRPATINSTVGVTQTLANYVAGRLQIYAADYDVVANSPGAAAANSTIINALMAAISALGGGTLILPFGDVYIATTLDNKYPRVLVMGAGAETFHDSGVTTAADPLYGTRLVATTATTMCKLRTPYAAEQGVAVGNTWKYTGSGFKFLSMNGGGVATAAMLVDSVALVDVDVYATNFNASGGYFYSVKCGVSGTDLGEACDVQQSRLVFRGRAIDTTADQNTGICLLSGSTNANTSLNRGPIYGISVYAEHKNGNLLTGAICDNNDIIVIGVRVSGGTGYLAFFNGGTTAQAQGGSSNRITYAAGAGAIYNQGNGDTNSTGTVNGPIWNEVYYDDGNGTPAPTAGTGSSWTATKTSNGAVTMAGGMLFNGANAFGYTTGAGGTVTQAASKSTGVTLNKLTGQITLNNATLNSYVAAQFTLTNSTIGANDLVIVNHVSGGSQGAYSFGVTPAAGSAAITVRNVINVNLSEAIVLQYAVIKSAIT